MLDFIFNNKRACDWGQYVDIERNGSAAALGGYGLPTSYARPYPYPYAPPRVRPCSLYRSPSTIVFSETCTSSDSRDEAWYINMDCNLDQCHAERGPKMEMDSLTLYKRVLVPSAAICFSALSLFSVAGLCLYKGCMGMGMAPIMNTVR